MESNQEIVEAIRLDLLCQSNDQDKQHPDALSHFEKNVEEHHRADISCPVEAVGRHFLIKWAVLVEEILSITVHLIEAGEILVQAKDAMDKGKE